jgi:hypothetical protein
LVGLTENFFDGILLRLPNCSLLGLATSFFYIIFLCLASSLLSALAKGLFDDICLGLEEGGILLGFADGILLVLSESILHSW